MSNMTKRLSDATPSDWNKITQSYLMKHNPSSINTTSIDPEPKAATEPEVRVTLTEDPQARKDIPMFNGLLKYFPRALAAVSEASLVGAKQHDQTRETMHWDRAKSGNEHNALLRHLCDAGYLDTDGVRHSAKVAWRALAALELEIEASEKK